MVLDIAECLIAPGTNTIDAMPSMYPYNARAALMHIHTSTQRKDGSRLSSVEDVIRKSLTKYSQRWGVSDDWTEP